LTPGILEDTLKGSEPASERVFLLLKGAYRMKEFRYRISQIKLRLDESTEVLPEKIIRKCGGKKTMNVRDPKIVRHSIDARDKAEIYHVYTVEFSTDKELNLREAEEYSYHIPAPGNEKLKTPPVVVGFGPCGMFSALILAEAGYRPVVLERGSSVDERVEKVNMFRKRGILDTECNVQFGEGGAGTFSDGKLTSGIKGTLRRKVLESLVDAGACEDILYEQKPHIGTDILRRVVKNIRYRIEELGGTVLFDTKAEELICENGKLRAVRIKTREKEGEKLKKLKPFVEEVTASFTEDFQKGKNLSSSGGAAGVEGSEHLLNSDIAVLAIGHSARDTFAMLKVLGIAMEAKPFSIGVRIEHPQKLVDEAQYGRCDLPPATYNLVHHCKDGRGVYTFCMCPGGVVISASSEEGGIVTNGMSYSRRNGKMANSGLLVDVRLSDFESDDVLAGIEFQRKYERLAFENSPGGYEPPRATWKEVKERSGNGIKIINSLPGFAIEDIIEAMPFLGKKLKGFDSGESVLRAVETRSSSPVRILRNEELESSVAGLFPGGEGAGYAGGIMSSAVDGIKIAERIIRKYRRP